MKTKHAALVACAVGCLGFAAGEESLILIPYRALGETALIIGALGQPLGEEVSVRGKLHRDAKDGDLFEVYEVNDRKLSFDRVIPIRGTAKWKDGTEATLIGYEEATITYLREIRSSPPDAPPFVPRQLAFNYFVPVEVVSPSEPEVSADELPAGRPAKKSK